MRSLFLFLLYNVHICAWDVTNWLFFGAQNRGFSSTGRVFVTLLGYPERCERQGTTHACTLSLACWWVGGSSQEGCGGYPWIVACCVTFKPSNEHLQSMYYDDKIENNEISVLQKRNDEVQIACGVSSDRILLKRIIGGKEATFAQFPWQAHIKISTYQCGGVLVSPRFVATAAHCIVRSRLKDITVYLGELDTQNTGRVLELAPSERHKVSKKIIHPKFKFRITQPDRYDLALLQLTTKTAQTFHILPICLPEVGINLEGRNAVVAGWGKIKPSIELTGTNVLRSAIVPILDIQECMSWHRIKQITVELYEEMLCAGHEGGIRDACLGDSGGPLIVLLNGRWTLAGIISAGFGCGEPHQPGIYHSVAVTADWIRSVIY